MAPQAGYTTETHTTKMDQEATIEIKLSEMTMMAVKQVMEKEPEYRVFAIRWFVLILFAACSMCNAFQWIQYCIIADVISDYYKVDLFVVDWLSMVYMVVYIPLVFPATYLLDKKGLKLSVLLGIAGTALGGWIKVFSVSPDRFIVTFVGQSVAAVAQIFTFAIPPRLAAVWFGPDQVSTACAIGVFGNQLGVALGFLLPPRLVSAAVHDVTESPHTISDIVDNITSINSTLNETSTTLDLVEVSYNLKMLFYLSSIVPTILLVLVIFFFENDPPVPPSAARATAMAVAETQSYTTTMKNVLTNKNFVLLLFSYSFSIGVMTTLATLLSQLVLTQFPDNGEEAGTAGLANVMSGLVGAAILGFWLDRTHRFKETSIIVYCLNISGMVAFTFALRSGCFSLVYLSMILLGLFMSAYLTLGFEYAAELTYPEPEGTTAGLLNAALYLFSVVFTSAGGWILRSYDDLACNLFLCAILLAGFVLTVLIKPDLRRQEALKNTANGDMKMAIPTISDMCKASNLKCKPEALPEIFV